MRADKNAGIHGGGGNQDRAWEKNLQPNLYPEWNFQMASMDHKQGKVLQENCIGKSAELDH